MGGISVLVLMSIFMSIFLIFVAIFLAIVVYEIIVYIFESISIMCMCKNLKYNAPLTAWIPFYNKYLLGKIADNKILGLISAILNTAITGIGIYCYLQNQYNYIIFIILLICALVGFIFDIVMSHKIYKLALKKFADIFTVLSVLSLGLLRPIFLFIIRNKIR